MAFGAADKAYRQFAHLHVDLDFEAVCPPGQGEDDGTPLVDEVVGRMKALHPLVALSNGAA